MAVVRDAIDSIMHRRCSAQPDSDLLSTIGSFARTAAEILAGVTPVNYTYAPGDVRRYGADPTGATDSATAFATAFSCNAYVFDSYPGGGSYIFNSSVAVTRYPLHFSGVASSPVGVGVPTGGTRITLQSVAGAGAAHFTFANGSIAPYMGVTFENACLQWQNVLLAQFGINATVDFRNFCLRNFHMINSAATNTPGVIGIVISTAGTYSGDGVIRDCYISGLKQGINLSGPVTTVKVRDCILFGNLIGTNDGIHSNSTQGGLSVMGCTIEGWVGAGINSQTSGGTVQIGNYFEGNGVDFEWASTTGNISIGEFNPAGGTASFAFNNASGNLVLGAGGYGIFIDAQSVIAGRGVKDRFGQANGYAPYGEWTAIAFSAGNFGGNGAQTWTVTLGNVSLAEYSVVGDTLLLHLEVDSSTVGGTPNTQLTYLLPVNAKSTAYFPCEVRNNGTRQTAVCFTTANSNSLGIYVDATRASNWAASAGNAGVSINIACRINQ